MPCNDGGPSPEQAPAWMLCEAMIIIDKGGLHDECSEQLKRWWENHQEAEEGRVRREAVAKLSPRERHALGLDDHGNAMKKTRVVRGRK